MIAIAYLLPVHNEEKFLGRNVERVCTRLAQNLPATVLLVENGSRDDSWGVAQKLAKETNGVRVLAYREPNAGIGYAYDRGLREALELFGPSTEHWAVLTAADLPFGFTDLDGALPRLESHETRIFMGSKAHANSSGPRDPKRSVMTFVYRTARRVVLDMKVGDSQGSIFIRLDLAAEIVSRVRSRDFFYSTELCYFAERTGEQIVELPVAIEGEQRKSTVRPLRDGTRMFEQLVALRRRK